MASEKSIERAILNWLNSLDNCFAYSRHGDQFSIKGNPDITGCLAGRHIEIEVKLPGKKPTKIQFAVMEKWERAGAIVGWATSLSEAQDIIYGGLQNGIYK